MLVLAAPNTANPSMVRRPITLCSGAGLALASLSRCCESVQLSTMPGRSFDADAFTSLLTTSRVGRRLEYRYSTTSTMTVADELLQAEGAAAAHGLVVLAETQTAGVGRRGRAWQSAPDGNLYFSLVWSPASAAQGSSGWAEQWQVQAPRWHTN